MRVIECQCTGCHRNETEEQAPRLSVVVADRLVVASNLVAVLHLASIDCENLCSQTAETENETFHHVHLSELW